jgi:hypothetical protein
MADFATFNPEGFTVQYGFPAYRVFVFGQEVSCDVTSVSVNWHDGLEPCTCSIMLANKNHRYDITHNDMLQIAAYRRVPKEQLGKLIDNTMPLALRVPTDQILSGSESSYTAYNPIGSDDVAHDPSGVYKSIKQNVVMHKLSAGGVLIPMEAPAGYDVSNPGVSSSPEFWSAAEKEQAVNKAGEWVFYGQKPTNQPATAYRFPFQVGKPIFHPYDPVRVFERDPYDPNIWYYMFSGFCSDFTTTRDSHGDSSMQIVAESPSKLLRYGRFTTNPGIVDVSKVAVREAVVNDVTLRNVFKNAFAYSTLPEIAYAMLFGINAFGQPDGITGPINVNNSLAPTNYTNKYNVTSTFDNDLRKAAGLATNDILDVSSPWAVLETPDTVTETMWCANGKSDVTRRKWGIGHIKLDGSKVFLYGSDQSGTSSGTTPNDPNGGIPLAMGSPEVITDLEQYQDYINHEVKLSDYETMRATGVITPNEWPTRPTTILDTITIIGQRPDIYPVDGGRLIMLIPRSFGGQNAAVTSREFISSFSLNTEWTTRQDVLSEIVERIEFVWYVSPKGDYIIEFPLYDFAPSDFGSYEELWTIPLPETQSIDTTFTDSKVYTQGVMTPSIIQNFETFTPVGRQMGRLEAVTLWHMVPTFGVRQAPIQSRGYVNSLAAARVYAHYCLNRLNADAYTQTANITPNLNIWLNRPVMMDIADHIGTVRSVTHNITWGQNGDMSTVMGLSYMRGWDGAIDNTDPINPTKVYSTVGGIMGRPLNYKLLFEPNPSISQPLPSGSTSE